MAPTMVETTPAAQLEATRQALAMLEQASQRRPVAQTSMHAGEVELF